MYYDHHVLSSLMFHGQLSMSCFCGSIYIIVIVNINWIYTHHVNKRQKYIYIKYTFLVILGQMLPFFAHFVQCPTKNKFTKSAVILLTFIYMVCIYPVNVYKYNGVNGTTKIVHETVVTIIHDDCFGDFLPACLLHPCRGHPQFEACEG